MNAAEPLVVLVLRLGGHNTLRDATTSQRRWYDDDAANRAVRTVQTIQEEAQGPAESRLPDRQEVSYIGPDERSFLLLRQRSSLDYWKILKLLQSLQLLVDTRRGYRRAFVPLDEKWRTITSVSSCAWMLLFQIS